MHLGLHYREESEGRRVSHTPGPWVFNGHHIYGPKHEDSKHPNGRVFVASVARGIHRADPLLDGGADRFGFDSEADVRLIAAAPELLEALEASRKAINTLDEDALGMVTREDGHGGINYWPFKVELLHQIDTAIAKARGVS